MNGSRNEPYKLFIPNTIMVELNQANLKTLKKRRDPCVLTL